MRPGVPGTFLKESCLALGLYTALALFVFREALPEFSRAIIGPPEDNMQFYWFVWHGVSALGRPELPFFHTHLMYYPEGAGLYFANYFYYGVGVARLLVPFWGLVPVFNFLVLHSFPLAGLGAFYLARRVTGRFGPSLAAGLVFAFNPSHTAHAAHHATVASIQFIPFYVLFFWEALEGKKRLAVFWAALFLALGALCEWTYLVYGGLFGALWSLGAAWADRAAARRVLARAAAVFGLAAAMLIPWLSPMFGIALEAKFLRDLPGHNLYVADLLAFFVPNTGHWLSDVEWIRSLNARFTGTEWEKAAYLGWANLLLIGAAFRSVRIRGLAYLAALAGFMVLAMGVWPHVAGQSLPIPLPYRALQVLPVIGEARNPSRIMVYAYLFLALLVALAADHFLSRVGGKGKKAMVLGALCALLFFDYYAPVSTATPVTLPPAYLPITADRDKDFGILEIPWDGARYMLYQTLHGIPCVQGYLGRRVEMTLGDTLPFDVRHLDRQKEKLIRNRVKYIVIHKRKMPGAFVLHGTETDPRLTRATLSRLAVIYAKTYARIYEDADAATFRVY